MVWKFCGMAQFPLSFGRIALHITKIKDEKTKIISNCFLECHQIRLIDVNKSKGILLMFSWPLQKYNVDFPLINFFRTRLLDKEWECDKLLILI